MAVFAYRLEREQLRLHFGLEVDHQAHHARPVAADAQLVDIGIADRDLAVQLGQCRANVHAFEVEHQALGILHRKQLELNLGLRLQRDAGVVLGRPDPGGNDLRLGAGYAEEERQCDKAAASQALPRSECATGTTARACASYCSWISRSGGASRSPARSGHSTMQSDSGLKYSRNPELSHS